MTDYQDVCIQCTMTKGVHNFEVIRSQIPLHRNSIVVYHVLNDRLLFRPCPQMEKL